MKASTDIVAYSLEFCFQGPGLSWPHAKFWLNMNAPSLRLTDLSSRIVVGHGVQSSTVLKISDMWNEISVHIDEMLKSSTVTKH